MSNSEAPEVSLTQLRYFIQAAEQSSMTKAAQRLYIAQSAVSSSIGQLENQLGVELFIRRRAKGLVLTAPGQKLLVAARKVLDDLSASLDEVAGEPRVIRGTLHSACYMPLVPFYVPEILEQLAGDRPELEVQMTEQALPEICAALESGRTEIALTYDLGLSERIERESLLDITPYAAVSARHPLADRGRISLAELSAYPMVLMDLAHSREYFMQCFLSRGLKPDVRFRTGNIEAVRSLVSHTDSFALLHQKPRIDTTYLGEEVVSLQLVDEVSPLSVVLARLKGVTMSARARIFADHAKKVVVEHAR